MTDKKKEEAARKWLQSELNADPLAVAYESELAIVGNLFTTTNFEGHSHEKILAMIEPADPEKVTAVGNALKDAAKTIHSISGDLTSYMSQVKWDGEGGEAFSNWGTQVASATQHLGDISLQAGSWMEHAGVILGEVKKDMPAIPAAAAKTVTTYDANHPDGPLTMGKGDSPFPTQPRRTLTTDGSFIPARPAAPAAPSGPTITDYYNAKSELDNAHGEAVRQMHKLATAYQASNNVIAPTPTPKFPGMPSAILPPQSRSIDRSSQSFGDSGGSGSGAAPSVGGSLRQPTSTHPQEQAPAGTAHSTGPGSGSPSATRLDGVIYPPAGTTRHPAPSPSISRTDPPATTFVPAPWAPPPVTALARQMPRNAPVSRPSAPTEVVPPAPEVPAPNAGSVRTPSTRSPSETGIYGGRPVEGGSGAGRTTGQLPRGTVVGAEPPGEPPTGARSPAGYSGFGGLPTGGSARATGAGAGGRRLASEPGGIVGGTTPRVRTASGDFTPGGTGLGGRNSVAGTPVPGSTSAQGAEGRRPGRSRPDYLTEDEATWVDGVRHANPPVIE